MSKPLITLAGAGLAGSLLAVLLRQRGFPVELIERRADPRRQRAGQGRSINLALAERGMTALRMAGVEAAVLDAAVPMRGRMIHDREGRQQYQSYSADGTQAIWSVSRHSLNVTLLEAAASAGATLRFGQRLSAVDLAARALTIVDETGGPPRRESYAVLIGSDGAGSAVREAISRRHGETPRIEPLGHAYKELSIEPVAGDFALAPHALHIWPRQDFMLIALPNADRSFTCTLFLGNAAMAELDGAAAVQAFFAREFPDACALMPDYVEQFLQNPVGQLATLYCEQWSDGAALILGDAAHAIVPFHGQGMNCAFEDCADLARRLDADPSANWPERFAAVVEARRPQARAIAAMALENYREMRDSVADPDFQRRKALEHALGQRFPGRYRSRYEQVSFSTTPYAEALAAGLAQQALLTELLAAQPAGEWDPKCMDWARAEAWLDARDARA
ncbi:MAG: FAD-dependent monooxygenase [Xanthomonadales bacterium]|jgi:kynurenine 3-monooxygenase|nr:FAD-dependent monooxygenase [Xanthomonadales bacterium]